MRTDDAKGHIFTPLTLVERDTKPFSLIDWSRLSWGNALAQATCFHAMLAMPNCGWFPHYRSLLDGTSAPSDVPHLFAPETS